VNAGAASQILTSGNTNKILALNGMHLNRRDASGQVSHFTVDRYVKRAWQNTNRGIFVPLTDQFTEEMVEIAIWKNCGIYHDDSYPDQDSPRITRLRARINKKEFVIVYISARDNARGLPDSERAREIIGLSAVYPKLRIIIGTGEQPLADELPGIFPIKPALDTEIEDTQFLCDCDLRNTLSA
jgi:hypothetical protein